MNIAVINGSPKGNYSITLQTIIYLEKKNPAHSFRYLNAGAKIKALERDFTEAEELLKWCDIVIFSYPVYTFMAPSQLHRFINILKERNLDLAGKQATQVSTSKHFYDITAHKYIEDNIYDLGMKYIRGLSADMEDLLTERGRADADKFFERLFFSIENNIFDTPDAIASEYHGHQASVLYSDKEKSQSKDILIITDNTDPESNLASMIARLENSLSYKCRTVNISEYPFSGGCLGCFRCAVSEKCVYKDGFDKFLRETIQTADAIIYAFSISDHSMGWRFKMYDDRNFCNGHRTVTVGMPVGYLVSGDLSSEENLRTVISARAEVGGNYLAGVAQDSADTDKEIDDLAHMLEFCLSTKHTAPQNFYGVGGMKIFRDLIYTMRGMMRADHKFYKKAGIYDFPQKKRLTSLKMYLVGFLLGNEKILAKMGNKMNEGMISPYRKLFAKMDKEAEKKRKKQAKSVAERSEGEN